MLETQRNRDRWIDRGLATGVLAAAACIALLLLQPEPAAEDTSLLGSLAPADPAALELLSSRDAPPVSALLLTYAVPAP